jgi:hypothetical protein
MVGWRAQRVEERAGSWFYFLVRCGDSAPIPRFAPPLFRGSVPNGLHDIRRGFQCTESSSATDVERVTDRREQGEHRKNEEFRWNFWDGKPTES